MYYRIIFSFLVFFLSQSVLLSQTERNFAYPQSVLIDPQNGHIWVSDFSHNRIMRFNVSSLSSASESEVFPPANLILSQNYPNPFNSETVISFSLPTSGPVELSLYNILGQKLNILFKGYAAANKKYTIAFDAGNLSSGVYLYSLTTSVGTETRRMCLLK